MQYITVRDIELAVPEEKIKDVCVVVNWMIPNHAEYGEGKLFLRKHILFGQFVDEVKRLPKDDSGSVLFNGLTPNMRYHAQLQLDPFSGGADHVKKKTDPFNIQILGIQDKSRRIAMKSSMSVLQSRNFYIKLMLYNYTCRSEMQEKRKVTATQDKEASCGEVHKREARRGRFIYNYW